MWFYGKGRSGDATYVRNAANRNSWKAQKAAPDASGYSFWGIFTPARNSPLAIARVLNLTGVRSVGSMEGAVRLAAQDKVKVFNKAQTLLPPIVHTAAEIKGIKRLMKGTASSNKRHMAAPWNQGTKRPHPPGPEQPRPPGPGGPGTRPDPTGGDKQPYQLHFYNTGTSAGSLGGRPVWMWSGANTGAAMASGGGLDVYWPHRPTDPRPPYASGIRPGHAWNTRPNEGSAGFHKGPRPGPPYGRPEQRPSGPKDRRKP